MTTEIQLGVVGGTAGVDCSPDSHVSPRTAPHVAGLILARGGSTGIPLKNMAQLGDRTLLEWSLGAMRACGSFDSIWVSTDHPAIAECARKNGAAVFLRSPQYAQSDSTSVEAIQEFLAAHPEVDVLGQVQCTSPFLRPEFLQKAFDLMLEGGCDSVFGVTRSKKFRWDESSLLVVVEEAGNKEENCNKKESSSKAKEVPEDSGKRGPIRIKPGGQSLLLPDSVEKKLNNALNFDPENRPRRQDWAGDLIENGMFYFARRSLIKDRPGGGGVLQGGRCGCVEVPAVLSLEIDSFLDLAFAEQTRLHYDLVPFEPSHEGL